VVAQEQRAQEVRQGLLALLDHRVNLDPPDNRVNGDLQVNLDPLVKGVNRDREDPQVPWDQVARQDKPGNGDSRDQQDSPDLQEPQAH